MSTPSVCADLFVCSKCGERKDGLSFGYFKVDGGERRRAQCKKCRYPKPKTHPRCKPEPGKVHCYDCGKDKEPEQFQIGIRGKPCSPCLPCRAIRLRDYVASGRRPKHSTSYATLKAWSRRNPHKKSAYNAVQFALRTGKLKRLPCEKCGSAKTHGHHKDYSRKLDVNWLCDGCHKKEHRKYA